MAKYKITISELHEYEETETVYEGDDGKRYYSKYHDNIVKGAVKVTEKDYPTGKKLYRSDEVYTQHFEADGIREIISAVNNA